MESKLENSMSDIELRIKANESYEVLQEYFKKPDLDELSKLLKSDDLFILRETLWILTELGESVCSEFVEDFENIIRREKDSYEYFAVEGLFLSGSRFTEEKIELIFDLLQYSNENTVLVLSLIDKLNGQQLTKLLNYTQNENYKTILPLLMGGCSERELNFMLDSQIIFEKYVAVLLVKKFFRENEDLKQRILSFNNEIISSFVTDFWED